MNAIRSILEGKVSTIHAIRPEATVLDAVGAMYKSRVGALLVEIDCKALGILSERDIFDTRLARATQSIHDHRCGGHDEGDCVRRP